MPIFKWFFKFLPIISLPHRVIHRYSLGWFNRIYIYSKLEVIMKTMLKAKGQKEIAHYWLYLMCFSSHTFLFPIKSFSIPSPYFLYIPIYSGAYIKSTMLSADNFAYTFIREPISLWLVLFTWLLSALVTVSGYAFIALVPNILEQYFLHVWCSINHWEMNPSPHSFI